MRNLSVALVVLAVLPAAVTGAEPSGKLGLAPQPTSVVPASTASDPARLRPVVEAEEEVYRYEPADNGAGPLWCHGSTCLVRIGEEVFASGLETLKDVKPLNNCRWTLFRRGPKGWELLRKDENGRTREPCPLAAFPGGPLFLSANPTLTAPQRLQRPGPAGDPRVLAGRPQRPTQDDPAGVGGQAAVHRALLPQLRRRRAGPGADPLSEHRLHARGVGLPRQGGPLGRQGQARLAVGRGVRQAGADPRLLSERRAREPRGLLLRRQRHHRALSQVAGVQEEAHRPRLGLRLPPPVLHLVPGHHHGQVPAVGGDRQPRQDLRLDHARRPLGGARRHGPPALDGAGDRRAAAQGVLPRREAVARHELRPGPRRQGRAAPHAGRGGRRGPQRSAVRGAVPGHARGPAVRGLLRRGRDSSGKGVSENRVVEIRADGTPGQHVRVPLAHPDERPTSRRPCAAARRPRMCWRCSASGPAGAGRSATRGSACDECRRVQTAGPGPQ